MKTSEKISQMLVDARVVLRNLRKDSIHERIHEATPRWKPWWIG